MLETICETLIEAYRRNWITSRDGNVSIRHHDRDHFYITPSGVRKQTLQPDQFKKIGILHQPIDRWNWTDIHWTDISKNLRPSGEIPLHFGLQKMMGQHRNDVRVVLCVDPLQCGWRGRGVAQQPVVWQGGGVGVWGLGCGYPGGVG